MQQNKQNQKFGLFPIRKCKEEEQKLIKDNLQPLKHLFDLNSNQTLNWVHVYLNEKFCFGDGQIQRKMKDWAQNLLLQLQNGVPHYMTSIGYIKSPLNSTRDQHFHFDYNETYKAIFIPLTYLVFENSPRFFTFGAKTKDYEKYIDYGVQQHKILQLEQVDCLTVKQVISKPFVIIKMESGTVHRGVKNRTNEDRYMLFIGYNKEKMELDYEMDYKEVVPTGIN